MTPEHRLRRLSRDERWRVYRRRRIIALAVLVASLLAILMLAGLISFPLAGAKSSGDQAGQTQSLEVRSGASTITEPDAEVYNEKLTREIPQTVSLEKAANPAEKSRERSGEVAGEPLDVLLLGVDKRPEGSMVEGSRADTIMLARVFPDNGSVEMLSIPRDMFVEIEPGIEDRINAAYAYGGVLRMSATVERLTGVTVDRHAIMDFQGFEDIVDAVDGVKVEVKGEMPRGWHMEGRQTLDGRRALLYARYRGTPGGDLDRIARQQQVVNALHDRLLSWNSLLKLPDIVRVAKGNVETDLGFLESLSLGRTVLRNGDGNIAAVQLKGFPTTTPDGREVLVPDQEENERLVRDFRKPPSF